MKLTDEEFKEMAERISLVSFEHSLSCGNDDCALSGAPGDCDGVVADDTLVLFQACVDRCGSGLCVEFTNEWEIWDREQNPNAFISAPTFEQAVREFARRICK